MAGDDPRDGPRSNYEIAAGHARAPLDAGGWVSLRDHLAALRAADERLHAVEREADERLADERDQRYAEVKAAEEKALKVKETADAVALGLQRETQTYKDEKANELRSQIERERGSYATKDDLTALSKEIQATIRPLAEYATSDAGRNAGAAGTRETARLDTGQFIQWLMFAGLAVGLLISIFRK